MVRAVVASVDANQLRLWLNDWEHWDPDDPSPDEEPSWEDVFYEGAFGRAAIQKPTGRLVLIDCQDRVHPLGSLDAWYFLLRDEYAERDGLPPVVWHVAPTSA